MRHSLLLEKSYIIYNKIPASVTLLFNSQYKMSSSINTTFNITLTEEPISIDVNVNGPHVPLRV